MLLSHTLGSTLPLSFRCFHTPALCSLFCFHFLSALRNALACRILACSSLPSLSESLLPPSPPLCSSPGWFLRKRCVQEAKGVGPNCLPCFLLWQEIIVNYWRTHRRCGVFELLFSGFWRKVTFLIVLCCQNSASKLKHGMHTCFLFQIM